MDKSKENLRILIEKLQAVVQSGKYYTKDVYDKDRYNQLENVSKKLIKKLTGTSSKKLNLFFDKDTGYITPKVDIRALTFKNDKLLLVKEKTTQTWSIPGGWADIGYSAGEIAKKETKEEAGIMVKPKSLIAIYDMEKHPYHEKNFNYIYKIFIECIPLKKILYKKTETSQANFFSLKKALQLNLSLNRNLPQDIKMAFNSHNSSKWKTLFD